MNTAFTFAYSEEDGIIIIAVRNSDKMEAKNDNTLTPPEHMTSRSNTQLSNTPQMEPQT